MLVRKLRECPEFIAGDASLLRELLHPDKQDLQIRYSLAHAKVLPGQITTPHKLITSEVYYILKGEGLMWVAGEKTQVASGCAIYIPPGAEQYIKNTGTSALEFICIVDPAWKLEDEKITSKTEALD